MPDAQQRATWLDRRHPDYATYADHWAFLRDSYIGGPEFLTTHLFQFWREDEASFTERQARAHRYNFTQKVVDIVNGFLWQRAPARKRDDLPEPLQAFWDDADREGNPIDAVMAQRVAPWAAVFGRFWVVVDKPPEVATDRAQERERRLYPYLSFVSPGDVLDARIEQGRIRWALLRERIRDDADPQTSTGQVDARFRLWTEESWHLYRRDERTEGGQTIVTAVLLKEGTHNLGVVPIVPVDHRAPVSPFVSPSLVWELAYLDRSIFNHISLLDDILYNVTFPQLRIPWQSLPMGTGDPERPGAEAENRVIEMSTKRAFVYDAQSPTAPDWMAPDPAPAQTIRERIKEEIDELFRSVALQGEMAEEVSEASGISREHEFRKLNKLLATMADNLEAAELRILRLAARWQGFDEDVIPSDAVDYPETFDVKTLMDELDEIRAMAEAGLPDAVLNEARKDSVRQRFSKLPQEELDALLEAIDKTVGIPSVDLEAEDLRRRADDEDEDE